MEWRWGLVTDTGGTPTDRRTSPQWLRTLADGLVDNVHSRGMTLTPGAAESLLTERISAIAATLHITERSARAYIDQEALKGLAESLVSSFADEAPGVDLLSTPRDAGLPVPVVGRLFAALAQCAHCFASYADVDEALSRSREHEVTELISMLGLIQSDHDGGDLVFAPRALFIRISRILEVTAELTEDTSISRALRNDAALASAGTKIHRWQP